MPYGKVRLLYGIDERHIDIGILLRASVGPVLGALHFHLLHQVGEHDDRGNVIVPDQSPKVTHCVGEGSLGSYVLLLTVIPLLYNIAHVCIKNHLLKKTFLHLTGSYYYRA